MKNYKLRQRNVLFVEAIPRPNICPNEPDKMSLVFPLGLTNGSPTPTVTPTPTFIPTPTPAFSSAPRPGSQAHPIDGSSRT